MNDKKQQLENRIAGVKKALFKEKIDTLMVLFEENRRYLSSFTGEDTQFNESAGALFITDTKLVLATDSRFYVQAQNEASFYKVHCYKEGLIKDLPEIIKFLETKRLGFESMRMSYFNYCEILEKLKSQRINIDLVPTQNIVENLRIIKEEDEIQLLKKALHIAESAFNTFKKLIEPEMTEKSAAWALEKCMREKGANSIAFPTIVASGPNSAMPHAIPGNRTFINKKEPIVIDFGAKLNGYLSDITRTVSIGKPDDFFIKVYNTVKEAQERAIAAIKPGISSKYIDSVARSHIEHMGFKKYFIHGLGHGIGLDVHEPPSIGQLKDTRLEQGMVFTIEPGIYIPDWGGIRLENMVAVQEHNAKVLNNMTCNDFII